MTISIIIPVYNVAAYLDRCVQSVVNQTYKAIEIILVDDGSKDNSGTLCDEWAKRDNRIQVIHKQNGGLSDARNVGLKMATGEYVTFLDGDDEWLLQEGLAQMVAQLTLHPTDLLLFLRRDIYPTYYTQAKDYAFETTKVVQFLFRELILTERFEMSACFQLICRKVLVDNDLYFPLGMLSEDVPWSMALWQKVQSVGYCNLPMYGYYHREGSISTTYSIRNMRCYDTYFTEATQEPNAWVLTYYAGLWTSCAYQYFALPCKDRKEARTILHKHVMLLQFAQTKKALRAVKLKRILGTQGAIWVLGLWGLGKRLKR